MSEIKVFKKEFDERVEEIYADVRIDCDAFEREEILGGGKRRVRTAARGFVYDVEVGEEDMFSTTDETWFTAGEKELKE